MATDPEEFFEEVQGAAVLKHGILRRYLAVFTGKLGSTAAGKKVIYLDAYAGPGEYEDGGEGSPALAKATAEFLSHNRNLVGIYVEKNPDNRARLEKFLGGSGHEHHILPGDIQQNFDDVLKLVGDAPLLAFFDPFGLTVPMEQLKALMERRRPGGTGVQMYAPTELIINVSYVGIARVCGVLNSDKWKTNPKFAKMRETMIERCNQKLGGDWWQPIATAREDNWVEQIAHGYAKRLHDLMGVGWFRVPVRDRPDGPVVYEILLVTRYSREAHWVFHEQISLGHQDYREFIAAQSEQQTLPIDEGQWVKAIKANIVKLLKDGDFVVRDKWEHVYGNETFGLARTTHVRKAIKELFKEGVTLCDGKKQGNRDLPDLTITRGPKAPT